MQVESEHTLLNVIATVYPEVYPSDMPPLLARLAPSHEYIRPHCLVPYSFGICLVYIWYLTLLVFRVLCTLVFWELYPIYTIHWINKLYPNPATA
jgi:hypothetical protein